MAHISENSQPLTIYGPFDKLDFSTKKEQGVELVVTPFVGNTDEMQAISELQSKLSQFIIDLNKDSVLCVLTSPLFAATFSAGLGKGTFLKLWVAIKLETLDHEPNTLGGQHCSLLVITKNKSALQHTKTRIGYSYCPSCQKTTKDYGGKKHLYNAYGTLMSDIWRDISVEKNQYPELVIQRISDLFGIPGYNYLNVYD